MMVGVGWKFIWHVVIERDGEGVRPHALLRFLIIGLVAVGIASVAIYELIR